jgi:MFS family permease
MLLAGRVLMGIGAVYTPVAAGLVVAAVDVPRRGRALAFVFLGVGLSYVVGIPLGPALAARFGWPAPLALVACAAVLTAALLHLRVPRDLAAPGASYGGVPALLGNPALRASLALTLLYFVAIFAVFAYIGPVLQALAPMSDATLSVTLALFGLSGVVGTLVGGARPLRCAAHAAAAAVAARADDAAGAVDAWPCGAGAGRVSRLGHRRLRHDGAAAIAHRERSRDACAAGAVVEHVDAVHRHRARRGSRRRGQHRHRFRSIGLGRRTVRRRGARDAVVRAAPARHAGGMMRA